MSYKQQQYYCTYSVADIGAATTPNDVVSLSWTTPDVPLVTSVRFKVVSASGGLVTFTRSKASGGASQTGVLLLHNSDDSNVYPVPPITDVAGANEGSIGYDATLFVGGVALQTQYIGAEGFVDNFSNGEARRILQPSTVYEVAITNTANVAATIQLIFEIDNVLKKYKVL